MATGYMASIAPGIIQASYEFSGENRRPLQNPMGSKRKARFQYTPGAERIPAQLRFGVDQ
ncbi:hypothetical protein O9K51_06340 [Purpureocillium lavendulum]|uniref:Uncharacterized protein n=1 Tax=Purpureocillium lavendulum TaxID=1247861 RepID=A0AB34FQW3_9HYPO|nr:hypothetical protein O9K51_06340 [Purpureocillium lavendulum]